MHWENKKRSVTHFIGIFALLWWSGTKPTMSLRYACVFVFVFGMSVFIHTDSTLL